MVQKIVAYTSGTTLIIPSDFVSLVQVICLGAGGTGGAGAGGANIFGGSGGGGGGYSASTSYTGLSASAVVNCQIGAIGSGATTWFGSSSNLWASGGNAGQTGSGAVGGSGGNAGGTFATTTFNGGKGGDVNAASFGGGGGGAAGPNGNGLAGGNNSSNSQPGFGGTGDNGSGGAQGTVQTGTGATGGIGGEWILSVGGSVGSGGGGGASSSSGGTGSRGGQGGAYGGGGAGGSYKLGAGGDGGAGLIVIIYNSLQPHNLFTIVQKNGTLYARKDSTDYSLSTSIQSGTWVNVCVVYSGAGASAYINGTLVGISQTATIYYNTGFTSYSIGSNGITTNTEVVYGNYGPVVVYNKALTATQVLQNFNAMKGRFNF